MLLHSIQMGIDWQLRDMIVWDVLTRQEPTTMTALIWDSHTGEHLADANGNILLEQSKRIFDLFIRVPALHRRGLFAMGNEKRA
jgi:hypothetical protein